MSTRAHQFYDFLKFFSQNSPFWGLSAFLGRFVSQITAKNRVRWLHYQLICLAAELEIAYFLKLLSENSHSEITIKKRYTANVFVERGEA